MLAGRDGCLPKSQMMEFLVVASQAIVHFYIGETHTITEATFWPTQKTVCPGSLLEWIPLHSNRKSLELGVKGLVSNSNSALRWDFIP